MLNNNLLSQCPKLSRFRHIACISQISHSLGHILANKSFLHKIFTRWLQHIREYNGSNSSQTELVLIFSTDMNKDKLKLGKIFCLVVCFWGNIIYTLQLELILLARKIVLTTKFDLSSQQTSKGYNIHTFNIFNNVLWCRWRKP